jgi:hypothetical protein
VLGWRLDASKSIARLAVSNGYIADAKVFSAWIANFGPKPIVGWGVSSGRFRRILIKGTTLQVADRRRLRRGEFAHRIYVGERISRQPLALSRFNVGYLNWFVCVDLAHRRGDQYGTGPGIAPWASMAIRVEI